MQPRFAVFALFALAALAFIPADAFAGINVKLTTPTNKAQLEPCTTIRVAAEVTPTGDSQVKDVYFYAGSKALGRAVSEPWEREWKNPNWGIYGVYARARDKQNNAFYSDTAYVTIGDPGQGSIIQNGGFDCALTPWNPETYAEGVFTAELQNDKWFNDSSYIAVTIENAGTAFWSCQLTQPVKIDSGHTYQISFWADAPEEKTIHFLFQNSSDPYNEFFNQTVTISDFAEYGPYDFVCEESSETVKFKFTFGGDTKEFYLDEVRVVDLDAPVLAVKDHSPASQPHNFSLMQNYPNPFNMQTAIRYEVPRSANVSLNIYNLNGQLVRTFRPGVQSVGQYHVLWNGTDTSGREVPTGVYIYSLSAETEHETLVQSKKMILLK